MGPFLSWSAHDHVIIYSTSHQVNDTQVPDINASKTNILALIFNSSNLYSAQYER